MSQVKVYGHSIKYRNSMDSSVSKKVQLLPLQSLGLLDQMSPKLYTM